MLSLLELLLGEIGGNLSHEFHMIVDSGESEIYIDESLASENFNNYSVSDVMSINSYTSDFYNENITKSNLKKLKSIELGHIFLFGNKYYLKKAFEFLIDGEKR